MAEEFKDNSHVIRHLSQRLREEEEGARRRLEDGREEGEDNSCHPTLSTLEGLYCEQTSDTITCWPPTRAGSISEVPCFSELAGVIYNTSYNATKECFENGTWASYSNYEACRPVEISALEPDLEHGTTNLASTLYYIGYSLSLVALLIAMWVFLYFKELRCLRNTIHTNLMFTYGMANFTWILTSIWQDALQADASPCVVLILVLHYFHTTTFFWMFVEGLYLYILVVETFTHKNIPSPVYMIIGWGFPVIIIFIWGITRAFAPVYPGDIDSSIIPHVSTTCHWMSATVYDWIFKVPILTVMALNAIFLVRIMWVLITKLRSTNNAETQQYRKAAKALLVLNPLLGSTYILTIVSFKDGSLVTKILYFLRAFLLSTQGLLVALFFCFLTSEVHNTVRHHIESWRTSRNLGERRYTYSKDWSPRSRTESIRLYSQPIITPYRKRESCSSEVTTSTTIGVPNSLPNPSTRISNGSMTSTKFNSPFLAVSSENDV